MSLEPGTKLGVYEILSPIGAGGMGEVYKARDPKLDRLVAIKVLPEHLAKDADSLARFEREAKALAALQHPNVLGIFDFGTEDGIAYAVMELLEGDTLRDLIATGPLLPRRSLDIAVQVARGLSAAHGKGIVHRDLKPENIFVMKDGRVRILDFGLAKQLKPVDLDSPTVAIGSHQSTKKGMILGTLGYMSPEQVRGEAVDALSDIFSFGSVIFELYTGQRAFARNSAADTMAAIMKEDPPNDEASNRLLPGPIQRIIAHCMEKDPSRRFQSAQDMAFALEYAVVNSSASSGLVPPLDTVRVPIIRRILLLASIALVAVLAVWLGRRSAPNGVPPPKIRFEVLAPEGTRFAWLNVEQTFAVSPDGRHIVFATVSLDGHKSLWSRSLAELAATPLPGTEGAAAPFWSPDSHFIAFFADGKLKKIDTRGGLPVTLCQVPDRFPSGSWGTQHGILFAGFEASGITLVGEGGGVPKSVLKVDASRKQISLGWPSFLPDGRHFLYLERGESEQRPSVRLGDTADGSTATLVSNCSRAMYVPSPLGRGPGQILFAREGNLMAQPFDADRLRLTGEAILAGEEISHHLFIGNSLFSASDNGFLASRDNRGLARLAWFDRSGRQLGSLDSPGKFDSVHISADSRKIVTNLADAHTGLFSILVGDLPRGVLTRLDMGSEDYLQAIWSPDATRIAFSMASIHHPPMLHTKALSGAGSQERLLAPGVNQVAHDWSPDGRFILYSAAYSESGPGLWAVDMKGGSKPRKILSLRDATESASAQFSPDGHWIAYCGTELGRSEIYLASFAESGERIRISVAGGSRPRWRRDGREIYFISADNEMTATPIQLGPNVQVGTAKPLFRMSQAGWHDYDVTPDGERFLMVENLPAQGADSIAITANWATRLGR